MRTAARPGFSCLAVWVLSLTACSGMSRWPQESFDGKSVGSFPYHPLVYHLDLSILAYQLHSQTLVWPFDPYYEEIVGRRDAYMEKVRDWARDRGAGTGIDAYRGPGVLGGFADNPALDPILYRYGTLHPWGDAVANADGRWIETATPGEITGQISEVYLCYRRPGGAETDVILERVEPGREDWEPGARDLLLAFEGGTGDKGEPGQPAAQSIMGFVLLRTRPDDPDSYDVHIAFRGSRSGSMTRAFWEGNWSGSAGGNPDWVTDLGASQSRFSYISTTGQVHRGFATSMRSILPTALACLSKVAEIQKGARPASIYITGHSLGGALAQHFVSAVLLGDRYGPGGEGPEMPALLREWPWQQIKLITYGAPRTGDEAFARELTESVLESDFFSTVIEPQDSDALRPSDPSIVPRLINPLRPAGYRVLLTRDPITTGKLFGGKHVGKSVYVNKPNTSDLWSPEGDPHDPEHLRQFMLDIFADPRIPPYAWGYLEMMDVNPVRNEYHKGSREELAKLAEALERYYSSNGIWYDPKALDAAVELRFAIEDGK